MNEILRYGILLLVTLVTTEAALAYSEIDITGLPTQEQKIFNAQGGKIQDFTGDGADASSFEIPVDGLSTDYRLSKVCLSIRHERSSDLKIELVNPVGKSIWLSNRNGSIDGEHYVGTCFSNDGFSGYIHQASAPFEGEYIPDGRLEFLHEDAPDGVWLLKIYDLQADVTGSLHFVSLFFDTEVSPLWDGSRCSLDSLQYCSCPDRQASCELLPDLVLLDDFTAESIRFYPHDHPQYPGQLRFAATIANIGNGPMEIRGTGETTIRQGVTHEKINQIIYTIGGQSTSVLQDVGTKYYDEKPGHDHYHVDEWVEFSLIKKNKFLFWSWDEEVTKGTKVSFCLFDTGICSRDNAYCHKSGTQYGPANLTNYGMGHYRSCYEEVQGISVGGYDRYGPDYEGQYINVPDDLSSGDYYLSITIDPNSKYKEISETNNTSIFPLNNLITAK